MELSIKVLYIGVFPRRKHAKMCHAAAKACYTTAETFCPPAKRLLRRQQSRMDCFAKCKMIFHQSYSDQGAAPKFYSSGYPIPATHTRCLPHILALPMHHGKVPFSEYRIRRSGGGSGESML
jgi:hypothetical protein